MRPVLRAAHGARGVSSAGAAARHPIVFLHGWAQRDPPSCRVVAALRSALPPSGGGVQGDILLPRYHPRSGDLTQTQLEPFLENLYHSVVSRGTQVHLVGYSVGGWLAAVFAERHPNLVASALLLAPAIDNHQRNFAATPREEWRMPPEYVSALQQLPARPQIDTTLVRTAIIHGLEDTDDGGSAPWRVEEWVGSGRPGLSVYTPAGVDHSLEPW